MPPTEFTSKISVAASPDKTWQAITDPAKVAEYHLAPLRLIELTEGGRIVYGTESTEMIVGKIVEAIPGKLLVHKFRFADSLEGTKNDPETTVTYRIEKENDGAMLTLLHTGFPEENQTYVNISGGWPFILDGLKAAAEKE
jgi:uncharacterized protein YndB with AHSA1/START domain